MARQAASGSFDCVTRDETVSHFAQDDNSDGSAQLYKDALTGEGGFDGVSDAVVAVGGYDAPAARAGEGFEVLGRVVHEDGAAGGLEHGDVIPVVADGEDRCRVDVARGGEREQGGALGAAGGKDVDDGEIARGILGAVQAELVIGLV